MSKNLKFYRLEDRILFEAAGWGDMAEAAENQPIAETTNRHGIGFPLVMDIDAEISQMLEGEIPSGCGDIFNFDFSNPLPDELGKPEAADGRILLGNSLFIGNRSDSDGSALHIRIEKDNSTLTIGNSYIHSGNDEISFGINNLAAANSVLRLGDAPSEKDIHSLPHAVKPSFSAANNAGILSGDDDAVIKVFGEGWNISSDGHSMYYLAKRGESAPLNNSIAGIYPITDINNPVFFSASNGVDLSGSLIFTGAPADVSLTIRNLITELVLLVPVVGIDPPAIKRQKTQAV